MTRKRAQNPGLSGVFAFPADSVSRRTWRRTNSQPLSGFLPDCHQFGPGLVPEIWRESHHSRLLVSLHELGRLFAEQQAD